MLFDINSFIIGVNSFASVTIATQPNQFDDLILHTGQSVQGIQRGLSIKGHGTFKFSIKDDKGTVLMIKIQNSMYVPDLKYCLLLPQHWAQTAPDSIRGTRMETDSECVIHIWGQGQHQRTVPHSRDANTPVFLAALATSTYQAFVARVKAMESQFHQREHVIQLPERCHLMHNKKDKFLAEENILLTNSYCKNDTSVSEGAGPNNETIQASNLSQVASDKDSGDTEATQVGPLTFDPTPQLEDDEQHQHVATEDQADLMRWHHCLGHLSFSKLKKLASIGKIPNDLPRSSLLCVMTASSAP